MKVEKVIQNAAVSLLILGVGIGGLIVFGKKPEVPTQDAAATDLATTVVTANVTTWNQPFNIQLDGEAVTYRVVTVGSEVVGRIVKKSPIARSGTFIKKGDVLFEIDSTNYQLEIERLSAKLKQKEEELKAVTVDIENAATLTKLAEEDWNLQQKQLERMQQLQARRTANETEVEAAMKQELVARNTLQTLRNQERTLAQQLKTKAADRALVQSELDRAKVDLERCKVVSTLEGRIVDDVVEEGDYVKAGDTLVHVSDSSRMEIKTKLRAEELAWVWQQHVINAKAGDVPPLSSDPINLPDISCEVGYTFEGVETIWDGYVARIEGTGMDRDTRTFPCRILVPEPRKTRVNDSVGGRAAVSPPTLLSGMFVTIRVPIESPAPLLKLPLEAVRPGGQVWVNRDGKLDIVEVSLAHVEGETALIRSTGSGLTDGDRVIISPLVSVVEDMPLKEKEVAKTTDKPAAAKLSTPATQPAPATSAAEATE